MKFLFLFLDGVGLGGNSQQSNPLFFSQTPFLDFLLEGQKLILSTTPFNSNICTLLDLDCRMGVEGLPQSATSQTSLITGINAAKVLGYHYGPKPNPEIIALLSENNSSHPHKLIPTNKTIPHGTVFKNLLDKGKSVGFINAYPPQYFHAIQTRRRNHSVFPLAATMAGLNLHDMYDLFRGVALSADFTGQGWLDHLNIKGTPLLSPVLAGEKLANLSRKYEFSFFEFWLSDYAGHKQDMANSVMIIELLDQVIQGLVKNWDLGNDLILVTSDHGNLEDLSTRKHTYNRVPGFLIGNPYYRKIFLKSVESIQDIAPFIYKVFSDF